MPPPPPWNAFLPPPPTLPAPPVEALSGKTILITGAGGFIGSELARRLAALPIKSLLLLDTAEFGLYTLDGELRALTTPPSFQLILGSVTDSTLLAELFTTHQPQIVFHTAALKHVPLLETNPLAAAQTNIVGTAALLGQACKTGARCILLSTDKAVDPLGIMGATKRFAELLALAQPEAKVVRLPNVLGSTGSVAPLFLQQIHNNQPLTITHPDTTRHFLTLETTAHLLLYAIVRPFPTGLAIPHAGPAHRIGDLAHFLMQHASTAHTARPPITYTGLRPGEKLHEAMLSPRETLLSNPQDIASPLLDVTTPTLPEPLLGQELITLTNALNQRNLHAALDTIRRAVPEYAPSPAA